MKEEILNAIKEEILNMKNRSVFIFPNVKIKYKNEIIIPSFSVDFSAEYMPQDLFVKIPNFKSLLVKLNSNSQYLQLLTIKVTILEKHKLFFDKFIIIEKGNSYYLNEEDKINIVNELINMFKETLCGKNREFEYIIVAPIKIEFKRKKYFILLNNKTGIPFKNLIENIFKTVKNISYNNFINNRIFRNKNSFKISKNVLLEITYFNEIIFSYNSFLLHYF